MSSRKSNVQEAASSFCSVPLISAAIGSASSIFRCLSQCPLVVRLALISLFVGRGERSAAEILAQPITESDVTIDAPLQAE